MKLAYLRPDDVLVGYNIILADDRVTQIMREAHRDVLSQFINYFQWWLNRINIWNISHLVSYATNNHLEGTHRFYNEKLRNGNRCLPFYRCIEKIGKLSIDEDNVRTRQLGGETVNKISCYAQDKAKAIMRMRALYLADEIALGQGRPANIKKYLVSLLTPVI
jgi:hypothetical protein